MPMDKELNRYVGNFEYYYETGMECNGCIFHDNRGLSKGPSFNNDTKKWDGPEQDFKSLGWAIFFSKRHKYQVKIFKTDGSLFYEGILTQDIEKMRKTKYTISFMPKELTETQWFEVCQFEYKGEIITDDIVDAEKKINNTVKSE